MAPADILCYARVRSKAGEEIQAHVEQPERQPLSREKLLEGFLAAQLILEEAVPHVSPGRLQRRMELLAARMADAIERENHAQSVVASRPVLPTVEEFEK